MWRSKDERTEQEGKHKMKGNENSIEQFLSWLNAAEKIEKLLVEIEATLINLVLSEDGVLQIEKHSLQFIWFVFFIGTMNILIHR